ncbi:MAG: YeeE/YedE thiosulfate transporter family protein [Burkholderiaceae bacterium]
MTNFPLDALTTVSAANPWTYVVFGCVGFAFGYTLESAGFGDSRKLAAQFYLEEFTVLKVMFTAIAVAATLLFGAVGLGVIDFSHVWVNPTYLGSGIVGGLIMGVGFIIGGFCPTTSLASASTGRIDGMLFMLGGFVGAFLFGESEASFDRWYNNAGYHGRLTLDQVFGVPAPVVVLAIVLIALVMFWGAEQLEQHVGGKDLRREPVLRKAGAAALVAGAVAVVVIGSPTFDDRYQRLSFTRSETVKQADGKAQTVMHTYSADEMLAKRLAFTTPAEAFKARYQQAIKPIYLDVRPEADFNLYHLADAVNVPLDQLESIIPSLLTEPPANTVFITIGNDEAAAVKAWKLLVASRVQNVYVLDGGINRWIATFGADDTPALQPLPTAGADQLRYAFPVALGDRYKSCAPNPMHHEKLAFQPRIVLQLKRDKSGGGCG